MSLVNRFPAFGEIYIWIGFFKIAHIFLIRDSIYEDDPKHVQDIIINILLKIEVQNYNFDEEEYQILEYVYEMYCIKELN